MVDLVSLPDVPRRLLFRYLDVDSLIKVRRTNQFLNNYVSSNHRRLARKEIGAIRISQNFDENTRTSVYSVEIKERNISSVDLFRYRISYDDVFVKEIKVRCSTELSFFNWLTNKFFHTDVRFLEFQQFHLNNEEIDDLSPLLRESEMRIRSVLLTGESFVAEDGNSIAGLLCKLRPKDLYLHDKNQDEIRRILTPNFYKMVFPWLKRFLFPNYGGERTFSGTRVEEIPLEVVRFPSICSFYDITPFDAVRRAVHTWYAGESEVLDWALKLAPMYYNLALLIKSLGLPHRFDVTKGARTAYIFRPSDNRRLTIAQLYIYMHFIFLS